ncbi:MAG: hypothetical protein JOZ15_16860 [Acidobacteria bacterium]|nr:hypothetical protein [Acidobacteriota bacterium]
MPDVNMPKLSDTMEEGTIVEWKKSSGDEVHKGEVLAEVESDKATFDLEAEDDGKLEILVEKGVPAKIGAPIARIGEGGGATAPAAAPEKPTAKTEQPKPEPKSEEPAGREAPEAAPEPAPEQTPAPAPKVARPKPETDGDRPRHHRDGTSDADGRGPAVHLRQVGELDRAVVAEPVDAGGPAPVEVAAGPGQHRGVRVGLDGLPAREIEDLDLVVAHVGQPAAVPGDGGRGRAVRRERLLRAVRHRDRLERAVRGHEVDGRRVARPDHRVHGAARRVVAGELVNVGEQAGRGGWGRRRARRRRRGRGRL